MEVGGEGDYHTILLYHFIYHIILLLLYHFIYHTILLYHFIYHTILLYHFTELDSSEKSREKSGMARPLESMASAGVSGLSPTPL